MLIEIKIQCDCGTKYKFDVEPLDRRLPSQVHCPGCGVEGTDVANAQLRQKLAGPTPKLTKTAPIPKTTVAARAVEPEPEPKPLLLEPVPTRSAEEATSSATRGRARTEERFAMGVMGAVVAGLIGSLAWFLVTKGTGYQIGFAAWGVGLLVGVSARRLGKTGSRRLGCVAAVCALLAILAGQWLAAPPIFSNGTAVGILTCLCFLLAPASAWKLGSSRSGRRSAGIA